jgi:hypothetical protein
MAQTEVRSESIKVVGCGGMDRNGGMNDLILHMCYDAIFDGLPVMRLNKYQYFMWDHDQPRIYSLQAFHDNYEVVRGAFRDYNFVVEYKERFEKGRVSFTRYGYGPPLARHDMIEQYLEALNRLIEHNGAAAIETQIIALFCQNREHVGLFRDRLREWILLRPALLPADSLHNTQPGHERQEPDGLNPMEDKENIGPHNLQPRAHACMQMRGLLAEMRGLSAGARRMV